VHINKSVTHCQDNYGHPFTQTPRLNVQILWLITYESRHFLLSEEVLQLNHWVKHLSLHGAKTGFIRWWQPNLQRSSFVQHPLKHLTRSITVRLRPLHKP